MQLIAESLHNLDGIALEIVNRALGLPAAALNQPFGAGKMVQRHHRLNTVLAAAADHLAVMLQLGLVKAALLRLHARPLDRKTVGIQPGPGQQSNVLLIAVVVVYGIVARLGKAGMFHLLLCPQVAVAVVALHLMRRRGRTQ